MLGIAISSRINNTIGSKIRPGPLAILPFLAYDFANEVNNRNITKEIIIMNITFLVIEKSSGLTFVG